MPNEELKLRDELRVKASEGKDCEIRLRANMHGILRDGDGNILEEHHVHNQVQTYMKTHVADMLSDQGENVMSHMGIGTGTGQAVGDSALATQVSRQALDNSTPSHSAAVVTYHRTFAAGEGTGVITEAGVFNAASGGDMGLYTDALNFTKGASSSYELTWTLTIG